MSFGFYRRQSIASKADQRRRAAGARLRKLHEQRFKDSSDLAKAGYGVNVVLMKRDTGGEPEMPTTFQDVIAKAARGEIDWIQAGLELQEKARSRYPLAKSVGHAMHLHSQTAEGMRDINTLHQAQFMKQQWDTRLGDGAQEVLKLGEGDGEGGPPARVHRDSQSGRSARVHLDDSRSGAVDSDADEREEPWDKKVQRIMDEQGCSKDAAISMIHRAEKISKGM
jgi:hypothetical protein